MSGMTKITWDQAANNGCKPLPFDFCSAMKNAARGSATTLTPDLTNKHYIGVPSL